MAVSNELGEERELRLSRGTVRYRERGTGPPIVFLHGAFMTADTWRDVVPRLADRHRCIAPDWPTGGHTLPMPRRADLSPSALADLVADFIEELALEDATLIGIGLGTVLAEILAIRHPERVGRIVFGSGDIVSTFPPRWARARFVVGFAPPLAWLAAHMLRARPIRRRGYMRFAHRIDDELVDSFTRGLRTDQAIRRNALKIMRAICLARTHTDHARLREFDKPALICWAADDEAFPQDHADELVQMLGGARLERIQDSKTFVGQDQPAVFAALVAEFVASTRELVPQV